MTSENDQNHGANVQNVEAPEPCDHVVGYAICEDFHGCVGGYPVTVSDMAERPEDIYERFVYCPRCGAKLPER